jgi:hypothetical protein
MLNLAHPIQERLGHFLERAELSTVALRRKEYLPVAALADLPEYVEG